MSEQTPSTDAKSLPGKGFGQLWQVPAFLLGVLCLTLVAANSSLRHYPAKLQFHRELAHLRQTLDDKSDKYKAWLDKCPELLTRAESFPAQMAEAYFLAGSLYLRASEEGPADAGASQRSKAQDWLEKAEALKGLADKDRGPLHYRLGKILYRQEHDITRAIELMKDGLQNGVDSPDGYEFLLQVILKQPKANLDDALKISQQWLDHANGNEETLSRARLTRGELLIRCDRRQEALRILEPMAKSPHKELRLKSLYLQARCREGEGQWRQAHKIWEGLLNEPEAGPGGKAQILYALGLCALNADSANSQAALDYWTEAVAMGGPEAQAAGLRLGEIQLASNPDAAVRCWTEALAEVRKPADYRNAYVSLDQVREWLESAQAQLMEARNHLGARKLAELVERLTPPARAASNRAQAYKASAQEAIGAKKAEFYHKAAQAFEQAATSSPAAEQGDHLWQAADCFYKAGNPGESARVLEQFVKHEKDPPRLAQGWLVLGQTYVAMQQPDKARQAFTACIDIPNTPSGDSASYLLAVEESSKNHVRAITLLKSLYSRNRAFADAGFLLGSLLVQQQKYDLAVSVLNEAINEAPSNPSALRARADLADCCRKLAEKLRHQAEQGKTPENGSIHQKNRIELLDRAESNYRSLSDILEQMRTKAPLSQAHLELLRLALFGSADVLIETGDVDEALRRFQKLQERYQKQVESLFACEGISRCLPAAKKTSKETIRKALKDALAIAEADLRGMDANSKVFSGPDVWTRAMWEEWINEQKEELSKTP